MPTQHSDIYNPSAPAIVYSKSGQTWKIADGVLVGSGTGAAVYSSAFNGIKLVNKGGIFDSLSPGGIGVSFQALKNVTVVNKATGSIVGSYGVTVGNVSGARNMTVTNHGSIVGLTSTGVNAVDVSNFELTNTGHIFGAGAGVQATVTSVGATDGPMIDNSGTISGTYGVVTTTLAGLKTTVVNESGGTIKGLIAVQTTGSGKLLVENHGKLKGIVAGSIANDKVVNDGTIKGQTLLGPGNDVYKNKGGHAGKVYPGDGNDKLVAGPHTDKFVFDTALNELTNVDRVKHFDPGTDKMFLWTGVFGALTGPGALLAAEFHKGAHAHDATDRIIYQKSTGNLYYDPDGQGGTNQIQFAQLDKHLHLHAHDFTVFA